MQREVRNVKFPNSQVVFDDHGNPVVDFRKAWRSACKRAGVSELVFHDLRRSAVRNMVRAGIPERSQCRSQGKRRDLCSTAKTSSATAI